MNHNFDSAREGFLRQPKPFFPIVMSHSTVIFTQEKNIMENIEGLSSRKH
jgi:hypothetical protein